MLLENDKLSMEFAADGCLSKLAGLGNVNIPIDADGVTSAFEIQLRDQGGQITVVTPDSLPEMELTTVNDEQTLLATWILKGAWGELAVRARVVLPNHSQLSYWTIEVDNHTKQALFQITYPRISGLKDYEEETPGWIIEPVLMGEKTPNPVHFVNHHEAAIDNWGRHQYGCFDTEGGPADIAYAYPGMWTMQFMAYGHPDSGGLYFAAYDPQALYKCFGFYQDNHTHKHAVLQMKQYPEDRTAAGKDFKSFYQCPIGLYAGEWWNASAIYREWALRQFWCAKGSTRDRETVPEWVKENDLWYWNWQFPGNGHPCQVVPIIKAIKERFSCNLAFHWYGSNGELFSGPWRCPEIYPENEDIRNTLKAGVEELHEAGIRCIPYLEARLVNPTLRTFREGDGWNWIARNEHGESADHWKNLGHTVCPTAPFFHEMIRKQVQLMIKTCDMDGAYLDQVSGCYPVPCFCDNHGHPVGGHDHWVKGYRELMDKVIADMRQLKPDSITTSEGVTECFIDQLDLDLAREIADLNGHIGSPQSLPIPMFHSVYHDYHITYGTVSTFKPRGASDLMSMDKFRYAEALTLVGGGQLMISGVFGEDDKNERFAPFFNYMEMLTRTRIAGRKWLNLGVWKPPVDINCALCAVPFSGTLPPKERIPAIISGCFLLDNQLCIILVNHTAQPQSASFSMDLQEYGLEGDNFTLKELYPETTPAKKLNSMILKKDLEFPPVSTLMLLIG
ncbi:MAG: hypothetical protein JXA52_06475 [Planctomycetes bacterium]|nr:hypothetical protein [Planctomycetota bacterium]